MELSSQGSKGRNIPDVNGSNKGMCRVGDCVGKELGLVGQVRTCGSPDHRIQGATSLPKELLDVAHSSISL